MLKYQSQQEFFFEIPKVPTYLYTAILHPGNNIGTRGINQPEKRQMLYCFISLQLGLLLMIISLIHVHIHPHGRTCACMHTCMHGHMRGWLHVFSHVWMAACIFACVDDFMYGSLCAWLRLHTGSESKVFMILQ